jgi:benzylsuccinate CoA-transferase BbsF subunit
MGNADMRRAPHGLYPTRDDDRWLSIAISSDAEWQRFAAILGPEKLGQDPRYATEARRHANRADLDPLITEWTSQQDGAAASEMLQAAGIAAHLSWAASDIVADPHMRARGSIIDVRETDGKVRAAIGSPARFATDDTPGITRGTPELGGDEDYVFGELLGLDRKKISALIEDKAIY